MGLEWLKLKNCNELESPNALGHPTLMLEIIQKNTYNNQK